MSFPRYPEYKGSNTEWIGPVPAHWELKRLGHYFEERREKASDKEFSPLSVTKSGIVPQLETAAKTMDSENRKRVYAGDFVINSRSDRKGSAGLSPTDGTVSLICTVMKPKWINPVFAHYLLRSELFQQEFYRNGKGIVADLWSTSFSEMKNIVLPIPPVEEQRKISQLLESETSKIDTLTEEQQRLIELLEEKRQAVISHAVTKGLDPDVPMKDTGVGWLGEVPYHWPIARIKHITSSRGGSTPSKENLEYWDGSIPWVSPKDMKQSAISDSIDYVTDAAISETGLKMIEPKSVLIVVRGMILDHSIPVALTAAAVTINQDMKALTAGRSIDPNYLLILLTGLKQALFEFVDSSAHGTKTFQWERFQNLDVPLPPLQEQQRICSQVASSNNLIDQLLEEANHSIQFLAERRSALISAAVTGKIDVRNWQPQADAADELPMAAEEPATYEARES